MCVKTADVIAQENSSQECLNKDEKVHFPSIPVFLTIDRLQPNLTSVVRHIFSQVTKDVSLENLLNSGIRRLIGKVYRSQIIRHTHYRTPLNVWCRCRYLYNTKHTQETNNHAFREIRHRVPSNGTAVGLLRLRSRSHVPVFDRLPCSDIRQTK